MRERFEGADGRDLLIQTLMTQKIVNVNRALVEEIADVTVLLELKKDEVLMEQGGESQDLYCVLTGSFRVLVNNKQVSLRGPDDSVGEMAAIRPTQTRSATVIANEKSVVAKLTHHQLEALGARYPDIYLSVARDLARRLEQRNHLVTTWREQSRVFIMSSVEALSIARAIQSAFKHDPFLTVVWENGVFRASSYAIPTLESELDRSDFGVAIAQPDDRTTSRTRTSPTPRDNVLFETGMFIGRLGLIRTILFQPRGVKVKLPSDFSGLIPITYEWSNGPNAAAMIAPACNELRDYINALGPKN